MRKFHTACLGIGSNITPELHISKAIDLLKTEVQILSISNIWETPSVGYNGPNFLNAAILIRTSLSSGDLKNRILTSIEAHLGRSRLENKNVPRTIDLDILIFDGEVLDLEIWKQAHIAIPVLEILPDLINPATGELLSEIVECLKQKDLFKLRNDILTNYPI